MLFVYRDFTPQEILDINPKSLADSGNDWDIAICTLISVLIILFV